MSTKHFFATSEDLAVKSVRGLVASNPSLAILKAWRVVYNPKHDPSKVALFSGGGSGHEPHSAGTVGEGMLAGAVCGDVFASPSARQVVAGVQAIGSKEGSILIITNYTGDMLHFGLAAERITAHGGAPVGRVVVADDCAVPRSKGALVGRRGLAGTPLTIKLLGAATAAGRPFAEVLSFGKAIVSNIVTIGAGLDHCHVPGRSEEYGHLPSNVISIGLGIHNEPGFERISPVPPPPELIARMLKYMLDPNDPERAFVKFGPKDETVLLVNNLGGVSILELGALADAALDELEKIWGHRPVRVLQGTFMTSLNGPSFSLTLFNVTATARQVGCSKSDVLAYLDAPTDCSWWPRTHATIPSQSRADQLVETEEFVDDFSIPAGKDVLLEPAVLEKRLRQACNNVIAAEPDLTKWDTVMGDGDCGETFKSGAEALLAALDQGVAREGSLLTVVHAIVGITESSMGGTLGAIVGIFFAAFLGSLRTRAEQAKASKDVEATIRAAAVDALKGLQHHTPATVGSRTVMDVLIPFVQALESSQPFSAAVEKAGECAEGTRHIAPKLGRATYVTLSDGDGMPPDPGAFGVYEAIRGLEVSV